MRVRVKQQLLQVQVTKLLSLTVTDSFTPKSDRHNLAVT